MREEAAHFTFLLNPDNIIRVIPGKDQKNNRQQYAATLNNLQISDRILC